jgi:hypothetical protein
MYTPPCPACGGYATFFVLNWTVWGHWCKPHEKNIWWDYDTFSFMGRDYLMMNKKNYRGRELL